MASPVHNVMSEIEQLRNELAEKTDQLTFTESRLEGWQMIAQEWKAIARERGAKLVNMIEKSQSTTKQLKLELDDRWSTDNFESFWQLQKQNKLTDFSLIVEGKLIQVHKVVLAIKSKFFAQQFEEHPEKLEYSIEGTTHEAVKLMVEFIYLGSTTIFDVDLNEVYKLSIRFHIDDLNEECVMLLEWKLSLETSPEMFILATKYKDEKLSQLVIEYVQENGGKEKLLLSELFMDLLKTDAKLYTEVVKTLLR